MKKLFGLFCCVLVAFAANSVCGDEMDFTLEWAPLGTFNNGSAVGTATIDTDVLQGLGNFFDEPIENTGFIDIELVVTGTGGGDGTFSSDNGDITTLIWTTGGPIDFTSELVGQPNLFDFNVGQFPPGNAPFGIAPFTFSTSSGDLFVLTSFAPAAVIPEPTSAAICSIFGATLVLRRRRS